jgi:hypothetical protein
MISQEQMSQVQFRIGSSKDGKGAVSVAPNAVYHDASGEYPALIVAERLNEFSAKIGDDKYENQTRPIADLRVCFGNLVIKKDENGMPKEMVEDVPVRGVALKGTNVNQFSKAWYEPLAGAVSPEVPTQRIRRKASAE